MCLAIPGIVKSIEGETALIDYNGITRSIRELERNTHSLLRSHWSLITGHWNMEVEWPKMTNDH